jgi:uncharacterized membrane protein
VNWPAIGRLVFIGLLGLYPFVVYFGIRILPATFFALLLAVVVMLRATVVRAEERTMVLPVILLLFVYAVGAAIVGRTQALLYYPVLVNTLLCISFTLSLRAGNPIFLRIVRARGMPMSEHGPRYLTRLTSVWAFFFAMNALAALWTTTTTLKIWTLSNGLISYVLVGTLILCEWLYRIYYQRKRHVRDQ